MLHREERVDFFSREPEPRKFVLRAKTLLLVSVHEV
jgi:hypothetical protein